MHTAGLIRFLNETRVVPASAQASAMRALLDAVTCAVAGHRTALAAMSRDSARRLWGAGDVPIWLTDECSTACGATFANAASMSSLDFDDGHRLAAGHPGASVIPAVLASARSSNCDAEQVLSAIVIGYEAAVRISAARDLSKVPMLLTGHWSGQAAAIATGWMRRLTDLQLQHAAAIAASLAPNLACFAFTREMGCHVKEAVPFAAVNGLMAVDLANQGFTGPGDFLDGDVTADHTVLTRDLGASWAIERSYFKPYSVCRFFHPAIESAVRLVDRHGFSVADIDEIRIRCFKRPLSMANELDPATLEGAQYSLPYSVALALCRGVDCLMPITEAALHEPRAVDLAAKIRMSVEPRYDAMFPADIPMSVEIMAGGKNFSEENLFSKGEADNPMTWDDLRDKFWIVGRKNLETDYAAELLGAVETVRTGDLRPLMSILAKPAQLIGEPGQFG